MNVSEVVDLAKWMVDFVEPRANDYEMLAAALEHNARQANKMPIAGPQEKLNESLGGMPLEHLNREQLDVLRKMGALKFLGVYGQPSFDEIIRRGAFDPATAASEGREAAGVVSNAINNLKQARGALSSLRIDFGQSVPESNDIVVRIYFKDDAAISNVVDFDRWAKEWLIIAQGIAAAVDDRPEDVRVIGASSGSVVVWLGLTVASARVFALLVKSGCQVVKDVYEARSTVEAFRHTKVMNAEIEKMFRANTERLGKDAREGALKLIVEKLGDKLTDESLGKLKKAIEKYFDFVERGGDADMIEPPNVPADDQSGSGDELMALRDIIEEVRAIKLDTPKLLPEA